MVEPFFGHGETDQSATELGHEVDGFGGDFFRRDGEIAFVFAVFVDDHHDHATGADLLNRGRDVGEWRLGTHIEALLAEAVGSERVSSATKLTTTAPNSTRGTTAKTIQDTP